MKNKMNYLGIGDASYTGAAHEYVLFTESHQLKNRVLWDQFVQVFTKDADDDHAWRCEYWGKMMRGACLTYMYHPTKELYEVLENAVRGLLDAQREDGRFATYSTAEEFNGWDMWGRKYVLTGMMHFMRISKDEELNKTILAALCRHADYIVEHVGDKEGQKTIFETSQNWLGVNSASILEPFVELYTRTGEQKYFDFATYLIKTGGCSGGNLIDLALEDKLAPYQYPEVKAYETMSYFEGVLGYYEVTGEKKYLEAVQKFVEQVNKTDITIIGCSGCTHELFDHSGKMQATFSSMIMQETCVTVTWMRLLSRLLLLTGEAIYADRIEQAAYNAMHGSVNIQLQRGKSRPDSGTFNLDPVTFDSYSPLYIGKRGKSTGGLQRFIPDGKKDGEFYGCCACIGSAGTALLPLGAALKTDEGLVINHLLAGTIDTTLENGTKVQICTKTEYPAKGNASLTVSLSAPATFALSIRIPAWCENATVAVNGKAEKATAGYYTVCREWKDGDTVEVSLEMKLVRHMLGDKTAYTYGALVMARDAMKDDRSVESPFIPLSDSDYKLVDTEDGELVRMILSCENGDLLLTDYASCGKLWMNSNAFVSVWLNALHRS